MAERTDGGAPIVLGVPRERAEAEKRVALVPDVVKRLVDEEIVLEVCPGSNIAIGVFPSYDAHPFPALREAGVKLTLSSDDPPFFHTSLAQEYDTARRHFGLDDAALLETTRTSIEAAFVDSETRAALLARLG